MAYPTPRPDGEGRRKLALAGAAVAAAVVASVGLVYLLVEFTAPPPENSATVRYRTNDGDSATPSTEATAPLSQAESGTQAAPTSTGTQDTLGASGTSTAPIDDPAPADTMQAATRPLPTPAAADPPAAQGATAPAQHAEAAPQVVARTSARSTPVPERRAVTTTPRSSQSRRCIDIIQRVSLGEPLTAEERDILKQECGQ